MKKNIIICCDGTGNQFGEENSNVVKLYACLEKTKANQLLFYDPGVGTLTDPGTPKSWLKKVKQYAGLALGNGLYENVSEAYSFLMDRYEDGDDIYLFGFSRGAYTVRVLAGLIHMCGLLPKGNQNQISYAWDLYNIDANTKQGKAKKFGLGERYKQYYSREVPIHFVGTWDTVSSVGWFWKWKAFPYTYRNDSIKYIRHAISIDETRAFYRPNMWQESGLNRFTNVYETVNSDVKQVWFAGVHSDVGGSYPEAESALAKFSLDWMIRQSAGCGLIFDAAQVDEIVLGKGTSNYVGPDCRGMQHNELSGAWWLLEYLPRMRDLHEGRWVVNGGATRYIPKDSWVHQSVIDRMNDVTMKYKPANLTFPITNIEP